MATLNINGRKVKVDDSFLSLTPDQQNATVDEIAASLGGQSSGPLTGKVEPRGSGGVMSANVEDRTPPPADPSVLDKLMNATGATVNGLVSTVPFLQNTTDAIGGTISQLTGGNYDDFVNHQREVRDRYAQAAPLAKAAGEIGGLFGGTGAIGATKLGAEALGLTGGIGKQIANSALSSTGLSTLDALSNGQTGGDALGSGLVGGLIGGILPVAGAGAKAVGRGLKERVIRPLATLANRENEVTTRLAGAIKQDTASGAKMTAADATIAGNAGADVLNADRFGSAIRTLARTASNISPEADNIFKQTTEQRFLTQGGRAVNYLKTLMGGATDDLALQDALKTAAQATNKVAYDAAFNAPQARAVWSPQIRELMQSDTFKAAIKSAESRGTDKAAIGGFKAVKNPFTFGPNGEVGLATMPDGSRALPSLAFWDQVKRNLDSMIGTAQRSGDNALTADLTQIKQKLVGALDQQVPAYAKARKGAAGFFGADDAIEAGKKAVSSTKSTPEIERAVAAMSPAEKDAFSVGFSSEIIDAINASKDRVNVINNIFGSQSARDRIRIALGPQRARELEAYVKVEQTLDLLRTATQGNSTTAKQLIQAGLMGGGAGGIGYLASGGDLTTGMSAATLAIMGRRGLQMLGKHVDEQVMKAVADILASPDPAKLQRAIQNASLSQAHMDALDGILRALAAGSRGLAVEAGAAALQPA